MKKLNNLSCRRLEDSSSLDVETARKTKKRRPQAKDVVNDNFKRK